MYAEPELLFGNLDELCCVTYGFCKEFIHLLLKLTNTTGELSTTEVLAKLFEPVSHSVIIQLKIGPRDPNFLHFLSWKEYTPQWRHIFQLASFPVCHFKMCLLIFLNSYLKILAIGKQ